MNKIMFIAILSIVLTGCATTGGHNYGAPSSQRGANSSGFDLKKEMEASRQQLQELGVQTPVTQTKPASTMSQNQYDASLLILKLNADAKPIAQKKLSTDNKEDIPFAGGPLVKIQDVAFNGGKVKLIQIMCGNAAVKQKFDHTSLIKGWTTQIDCGPYKYMIIGE